MFWIIFLGLLFMSDVTMDKSHSSLSKQLNDIASFQIQDCQNSTPPPTVLSSHEKNMSLS